MIQTLFTNDVETTSLVNHRLQDSTADYVLNQGMPRLLDLYSKYGVRATFFFTGHIAKLKPQVVRMAFEAGHEVGSHGLTHQVDKAFDVLSLEEQVFHLSESKKVLEDIIGEQIISFRAPAARVNQDTGIALRKAGYLIDSSISSQRLDMFLSFGALKKLNWLSTPRRPYFTSKNSIFRKSEDGSEELLEIPISAIGLPYTGTFMRISPVLFKLTRNLLLLESKMNERPFVFLTHPNEFIDEPKSTNEIQRRSNNPLSYLLGDVVRYHLKLKNLGSSGLPLLEDELKFHQKHGTTFTTCRDIYDYLVKEPMQHASE